MTRIEESVEDKLARLTAETAALRPRADFAARMMSRIDSAQPVVVSGDWSLQVLRWARVGMTMASLAAAACVFIAWDSSNAADQEEAMAYGIVEAFQ